MATPDLATCDRLSATLPEVWLGRAFGLDIESNREILSVSAPAGAPLQRPVRLEFSPPGALRGRFPRTAPVLVERLRAPGRPMVRVELERGLGFHIWSPRHGRHLVSPAGTSILSSVPAPPDRRWERLLLAQPLPLAAVLQGLELLHASAVRVARGIVGFVASSGTGKTSVAAHLVAGGASLVTDDILALEATGNAVTAHAGGHVLHLADPEFDGMPTGRRDRLQLVEGRTDKLQLMGRLSSEPAPLAGLYFLERKAEYERLDFVPLSPPSPKLLLSGAFLTYLMLPDRLQRQLELCARLAATVPVFRAQVPQDYGAARLAEAVDAHTEREL